MTINTGLIDLTIRLVLGLALIAWAIGVFPESRSLWGWLGVIPLTTGLIGYCPFYHWFGWSTFRGPAP